MKKVLFSLMCLLLTVLAFSQEEKDNMRERADRNIILKWAPGSLTAGKLTLGGEYHFKKKNSFELIFGFPTPATHQFKYDSSTSSLQTRGASVLAAYRYYLGKRSAAGFYIEPYYKYLHHQVSGFLQGDLNGESASFDMHTDYKGNALGLQMGVQFFIAKTVSIDFFFLGPEANIGTFSTTATDISSTLPWSDADASKAQQDIKDALKIIPIVGSKMDVQVDQNAKTVTTQYKGFLPGIRFGISVGVKI
jgi:hypothetical protein